MSICPCEGEQAEGPSSKITPAAALSDAYPVCNKNDQMMAAVSFRDPSIHGARPELITVKDPL